MVSRRLHLQDYLSYCKWFVAVCSHFIPMFSAWIRWTTLPSSWVCSASVSIFRARNGWLQKALLEYKSYAFCKKVIFIVVTLLLDLYIFRAPPFGRANFLFSLQDTVFSRLNFGSRCEFFEDLAGVFMSNRLDKLKRKEFNAKFRPPDVYVYFMIVYVVHNVFQKTNTSKIELEMLSE